MLNTHNIPGHLNIYKLDQDSYITSFGKHDRVIASYDSDGVTARVDHVWHLGMPSIKDMRKIIKHDFGFTAGELYQTESDEKSTWFEFRSF